MFKTPVDGVQTQLNLCYIPFNEFISGAYYADCRIKNVGGYASDMNKVMECMKLTIEEIRKRFPETKIFDILKDMKDTTIIISSHMLSEIENICDKVIFIMD